MTPEGKVKAKVKRLLAKYKLWGDWPVPSGYGKSTLDWIGCVGGQFVAIETKPPGGKLTDRQELTVKAMEAAGAKVFLVAYEADLRLLKSYLDLHADPKDQPDDTAE